MHERSENGQARDKVAAAVGVGSKAIDKAAKISTVAPDLAEKVKQGQIELEPAYREARQIEKQRKSVPVETVEIYTVTGKKRPFPNRKPSGSTAPMARWIGHAGHGTRSPAGGGFLTCRVSGVQSVSQFVWATSNMSDVFRP